MNQVKKESKFIQIETLVESKEIASGLAKYLIDEKIAACVNIFSGVESYYCWKEELEIGHEVKLSIKTKRKHFTSVQSAIKRFCSYDVPCIFSCELDEIDVNYRDFLDKSC